MWSPPQLAYCCFAPLIILDGRVPPPGKSRTGRVHYWALVDAQSSRTLFSSYSNRPRSRVSLQDAVPRATPVPDPAGNHGERRWPAGDKPSICPSGQFAGHSSTRLTSLLKRRLPGNQRQRPASAGHECAAVLGEKEQGEPCPIARIDQRCAHRPVVFPDELHCSLQAKGFESVHPHALKSATEDSGMRASGLYPLLHRVGGAAAEGGQSYHGRLVITDQQRFQRMPFHGHPVWIVRYSSQIPQPW